MKKFNTFRTNFHSPRACQLTYIQYARVVILGGGFRVMHRFSDLMSHSNSMLNGEQLRQSHVPVNSCTSCTLGLPAAWFFSIRKNARQVTSVFELYFSVSGFYFFAFFSLPRPLRNLRKPPFLPLSISSIPASARSLISPIDQDAIAR